MSTAFVRPCWWCGAPADSGEHKFKRSDLVRAFGGGEWGPADSVAHVLDADNVVGYPRSSRANRLKFGGTLCRDCNSRRSQPFDTVYDAFAEYLHAHERRMTEEGRLDWADVFRDSWRTDLKLLVGYWVKHIACRLAWDGVPVHPELPEYLNGRSPLAHLRLQLEIRDDIATAAAHLEIAHGTDPSTLWIGPAQGEYSGDRGHIVRVWSHWGFGAIRLRYMYDWEDAAADVTFDSQVVQLPRYFNVDPARVVAECSGCNLHK